MDVYDVCVVLCCVAGGVLADLTPGTEAEAGDGHRQSARCTLCTVCRFMSWFDNIPSPSFKNSRSSPYYDLGQYANLFGWNFNNAINTDFTCSQSLGTKRFPSKMCPTRYCLRYYMLEF